MAFNRSPLRAVTQDDIDTYARDGAVSLRQVFDKDWIDSLLHVAKEIKVGEKDFGLLPNIPNRYMSRMIPEFRRLAFESPLGEACGKVLQSKEIRFFFDEIFAKPPNSDRKTIWHCDRMGWPVAGKMVPSLWMPLTPITKANSLECVADSFTHDVPYWLFSPNARKMIQPEDRPTHPDIEPLRDDPNVTFLSWEMEPGDLLIIHPWELHYSGGNPTDDWRVAISTRVFGDDITWKPRPDCLNLAGVSWDEMIEGERPAGQLFPLIWSEDGRRDTGEDYPRGFATTWSANAGKGEMGQAYTNKGGFEKLLAEKGGGSKVEAETLVRK